MRDLMPVKYCKLRGRLYNEDLCKKLEIFSIQDSIAENKMDCSLNRMPDIKLLKEVWQYNNRVPTYLKSQGNLLSVREALEQVRGNQ